MALAGIDLGLAHPASQRLGTEAKPSSDALARDGEVRILIEMVKDQPHSTLLGVLRDSLWHGVYLPSRLERKRHQTGDGSGSTN